jgi:uncharacterized protein YndB with AHSA1/START domain
MMPVKKEAPGRRYVQIDVEVPGTPEQVWQAIATGAGISSWFAPTDVEERDGGAIAFHLGPAMDSRATITAWEPSRRLAYEERDWAANAPPLASEFTIHARAGGTCTLRVVHSLFASSDEWDDQLESIESGWPSFFEVLRLYVGHFSGQPCSSIRITGTGAGTEAEAWDVLTRGLGLAGATPGQRPGPSSAGAPPFDGVVRRIGQSKHLEMLVVLERPTTGAALFGVYTWDKRVIVAISLYLYGPQAAEVMTREEPLWRDWLEHAFLPVPS